MFTLVTEKERKKVGEQKEHSVKYSIKCGRIYFINATVAIKVVFQSFSAYCRRMPACMAPIYSARASHLYVPSVAAAKISATMGPSPRARMLPQRPRPRKLHMPHRRGQQQSKETLETVETFYCLCEKISC